MVQNQSLADGARAASAPPAPAPCRSWHELFIDRRRNLIRNLFHEQNWDRLRCLLDHTRLMCRARESQLITTKRDFDIFLIQPYSNQLLEQLHGNDLAHTARCFDRLP